MLAVSSPTPHTRTHQPHRRDFLRLAAASLLVGGCRFIPEDGLTNPCLTPSLPADLRGHPLYTAIWDGIAPGELWDVHTHLLGSGDSGSGIWLNPRLSSWRHPIEHVQALAYRDGACLDAASGNDLAYVQRLRGQIDSFPAGARALLLAFDYCHDAQGRVMRAESPFHVPNPYAAGLARAYPDRFGWIASIHPDREDALDALDHAIKDGARAVKWIPQVMGIDPASPRCDRFYAALARHGRPLLTHAGREVAVHVAGAADFGNPLRLRRALEQGVRVIVAHCASLGEDDDMDAHPRRAGRRVPSFTLFARLMDEPQWHGRLYGDISMLGQVLRLAPLATVLARTDWHDRLLYGSDYPLPAVMPVYSLRALVAAGHLRDPEREWLLRLRRHNALLFNFALMRLVRHGTHRFAPAVFHTRARLLPYSSGPYSSGRPR